MFWPHSSKTKQDDTPVRLITQPSSLFFGVIIMKPVRKVIQRMTHKTYHAFVCKASISHTWFANDARLQIMIDALHVSMHGKMKICYISVMVRRR